MNPCIKTMATGHKEFDELGYLYLPQLFDYRPYDVPPDMSASTERHDQVKGSLANYKCPSMWGLYNETRMKLEELLGRKMYNTYYYERYYFPGNQLTIHTDRDSCEISVSAHIGTNLPGEYSQWPLLFGNSDDTETKCILAPGDGIVYKGADLEHWRNQLTSPYQRMLKGDENYYYHQVFFHYVLQDGYRAHFKNDPWG